MFTALPMSWNSAPTVTKTCKDAFLGQMVTEPTRTTETSDSILELFFTSNDTLVYQTRLIPSISDHDAVFLESSLRPIKKQSSSTRKLIMMVLGKS